MTGANREVDPMTEINHDALVELVRQAMGSGAVVFCEKAGRGEMDMAAPVTEAFGDFPAEFLRIRPDLVDALTAERP